MKKVVSHHMNQEDYLQTLISANNDAIKREAIMQIYLEVVVKLQQLEKEGREKIVKRRELDPFVEYRYSSDDSGEKEKMKDQNFIRHQNKTHCPTWTTNVTVENTSTHMWFLVVFEIDVSSSTTTSSISESMLRPQRGTFSFRNKSSSDDEDEEKKSHLFETMIGPNESKKVIEIIGRSPSCRIITIQRMCKRAAIERGACEIPASVAF